MKAKRLKPGIYYHEITLEMLEVDYDNYFDNIAVIRSIEKTIQVVGAVLRDKWKYLGQP